MPPARPEPVVDIRPPGWFARLALVVGIACGAAGLFGMVAYLVHGDPITAGLTLLAGAVLAAMMVDVTGRRATSHGGELELRQWYRTRTLRRDDIQEFAAARASFVRWDIVAVTVDETQVRLWVTRMLPAGRATRQRWLAELEAWRTWIGSAPS